MGHPMFSTPPAIVTAPAGSPFTQEEGRPADANPALEAR